MESGTGFLALRRPASVVRALLFTGVSLVLLMLTVFGITRGMEHSAQRAAQQVSGLAREFSETLEARLQPLRSGAGATLDTLAADDHPMLSNSVRAWASEASERLSAATPDALAAKTALAGLLPAVDRLLDVDARCVQWAKQATANERTWNAQGAKFRSDLNELRSIIREEGERQRLVQMEHFKLIRNASAEEAKRLAIAYTEADRAGQGFSDSLGELTDLALLGEHLIDGESHEEIAECANNRISPLLAHLRACVLQFDAHLGADPRSKLDRLGLVQQDLFGLASSVDPDGRVVSSDADGLCHLTAQRLDLRAQRIALRAELESGSAVVNQILASVTRALDDLTAASMERTERVSTLAWWTLVLCAGAGLFVYFFLGQRAICNIRSQMARIEQSHEQLRQASNAAEQASVAKTQFLANMSHEIRTPMTAILGYAELLLDPAQNESARRDSVLTIRRNGEHLLSIINDILDISKIEAGHMSVERYPTDPVALLEEVCSLMRVRAATKGVGLVLRVCGTLPSRVLTDPTRLKQILINIVGNAIKFTERGDVVITAFAVASPEPGLRFEVADAGIGMTPEQVSRLFRAFSQADASTTRRFGGTGLGLSISKHLAQMLEGDISVRSEPGKGSTFTVAVAAQVLRDSDAAQIDQFVVPRASSSAVPTGPSSLEGSHILLAEDGPDNQRLIAFHLRKAGAAVELADNGQAALDLLSSPTAPRFDLVLMDMQMPVMDGYEAARNLRARQCQLPVIALTAHAMDGDRDRCIQAGCSDYLTKPIDRVALVQTCARWLAVSRANNQAQHPQQTRPTIQQAAA